MHTHSSKASRPYKGGSDYRGNKSKRPTKDWPPISTPLRWESLTALERRLLQECGCKQGDDGNAVCPHYTADRLASIVMEPGKFVSSLTENELALLIEDLLAEVDPQGSPLQERPITQGVSIAAARMHLALEGLFSVQEGLKDKAPV